VSWGLLSGMLFGVAEGVCRLLRLCWLHSAAYMAACTFESCLSLSLVLMAGARAAGDPLGLPFLRVQGGSCLPHWC